MKIIERGAVPLTPFGVRMKATIPCFLALALLAGCATGPRTVRVPISQPCISGEIPEEPPHVGERLTGNAERDIGIISGSAIRLRAWGKSLHGMLQACKS